MNPDVTPQPKASVHSAPPKSEIGNQKSEIRALGALCLAFFAIHAGFHVARGTPEEVLWGCTMGTLVAGAGLVAAAPTLLAVGVFWLSFGLPMWALYLAGGGEFLVTSLLTHLGGLAAGYAGVWKLGLPAHVWWKATAALFALMLLSRFVTPARANVNLAHAVHSGWERAFPSHALYIAALTATSAAFFAALQFGLPKLGFRRP